MSCRAFSGSTAFGVEVFVDPGVLGLEPENILCRISDSQSLRPKRL